ncbi:NAD-binding protein, partial [Planomonospora parontospora]|uniref:NAD-binding protein n=1 Tax=Planomonospora parontospora TaxID=58119 RepID=UPI00357109E0
MTWAGCWKRSSSAWEKERRFTAPILPPGRCPGIGGGKEVRHLASASGARLPWRRIREEINGAGSRPAAVGVRVRAARSFLRGQGQAVTETRNDPVVVIGLGRFGGSLAVELVRRGTEVLAIDSRPKVVQ